MLKYSRVEMAALEKNLKAQVDLAFWIICVAPYALGYFISWSGPHFMRVEAGLCQDQFTFFHQTSEVCAMSQGLDLKVPAGTSCAIVGTSGSGKSTLMRLLFRMFDSTKGTITINGNDIKEASDLSSVQSLRTAKLWLQFWWTLDTWMSIRLHTLLRGQLAHFPLRMKNSFEAGHI